MTKLVNRAKMKTTTTGTGSITLGAVEAGYQSFSAAGVVNTDVVRYVIEDGIAWEISYGTYSAGTLTRTLEESSTGALLNLSGNAVVYVATTDATFREQTVGIVTGNADIDLSTGNVFSFTPTADVTFAFSNPPAAGNAQAFNLALTGAFIDNSYDLANAQPPVYGRFSVAAEELFPTGMFFKHDGLKMYVVGDTGNDIIEYDLSTAWDISTASYLQNFSVGSQESSPQGVFFKPDGLKMYVIGQTGDDINEYDLSTAWDISTATFLQNFSVAAQEIAPYGIFFKPDGLKMYVVGTTGDAIYEYDLSTAWDVSTASFLQNFSVAAQDTIPHGLFFKPDGLKMYIIGDAGNDVNEYNLSTAWDVSTASFLQTFSVAAQEISLTGLFFKPDGLKMYIIGTSGDAVYSYTLTTAWDVSTASFDFPAEGYFSVAAQEASPSGLFFKPDGTKMYVIGSAGDDVNEYDLSTAWEVSTAAYLQNFSVATQESQPSGLFFKPDGLKMYIVGYTGDAIYEYNLSTAWNISTATFLQNLSLAAQETVPTGLFFKPDGLKMYIIGREGDDVNEYNLSTAWDVSTASFLQNFSVGLQEVNPESVFFKPDGLKMYVTGQTTSDAVNEYNLSTAWNISTATYFQNFSVAAQDSTPQGLFFGDNGTKMYIIGQASDAVWQYSTGTFGDVTFTYPASVKWPSGTTPTAPADGETDLLTFYTDDGGVTYYGIQRGDNMS